MIPKSQDSKAREVRRFRFGLRTLFVTVTVIAVVAGWVGYEYRIVHERQEVLNKLREKGGASGIPKTGEVSQLSWIRRALGDVEVYGLIGIPADQDLSAEEQARIKAAFPEATLVVIKGEFAIAL